MRKLYLFDRGMIFYGGIVPQISHLLCLGHLTNSMTLHFIHHLKLLKYGFDVSLEQY